MRETVRRNWIVTILAMIFCIMIGCATALIIGRTLPPTFWIIWGGNTDSGNGQGDGQARQQLIAGGWTDEANSFQVTWKADIGQGTAPETDAAMPAGKEAWSKFCSKRHCVNAGFSLGSMPTLQLSAELGIPSQDTYVFGAPQPSTGIWHIQYQDNMWVEPGVEMFGQLRPDRFVPPGTQVFYDTRDPYNNAAPQCSVPFALTADGHRIVTKAEADASHIWTGTDGAVMHEVGYVAQPGLPLSGSDPSPIWAGCEFGDWHNTPNSPGPQVNPDQPGIPGFTPGLPSVPGIPQQPEG